MNFKKRSGAKYTYSEKKKQGYITGWKSGKSGFTSFFAFPYKGTRKVKNKAGRIYYTWMLEITPKDSAAFIVPCLYDEQQKKVVCISRNLVLKPSAPNGGYTGKWISKNYRR